MEVGEYVKDEGGVILRVLLFLVVRVKIYIGYVGEYLEEDCFSRVKLRFFCFCLIKFEKNF